MLWALNINDPEHWILKGNDLCQKLIFENDFHFKKNLDKYKYADRFPEYSKEYYRSQCEIFLNVLDEKLKFKLYLIEDRISLADIAIFPFVRQFFLVDENWFLDSKYDALKKWLRGLIDSHIFKEVMKKN
jgi:glutathione S-transferase